MAIGRLKKFINISYNYYSINSLFHSMKDTSQQLAALNPEQKKLVSNLLSNLNFEQKLWLGGYLTGLNQSTSEVLEVLAKFGAGQSFAATDVKDTRASLSVLFGTRSGNAQKVAKNVMAMAQEKGVLCKLVNLNEYNPKQIRKEEHVFIIVSTDGEGDPPVAAEEFYNYIMGKKAPKLEQLKYSVLALGDKSYQHFCKIGKDIDARLKELGASSIAERIDCDVDFEDDAERWAESSLQSYIEIAPKSVAQASQSIVVSTDKAYSQKSPYKAPILERLNLNGRGSGKATYHIEFDIEDSGITYSPGDAVGVMCHNNKKLVEELIKKVKLNADTPVKTGEKEKPLQEALTEDFEITTLTLPVVKAYAGLSKNPDLNNLVEDQSKLTEYVYGRDLIDLIEEFPVKLTTEQLVSVLRKLQPRLYSIASSYNANPDEVHLTVGSVKYQRNKRNHFGVCSNFLIDIPDDQPVPIYIDENISFRLPEDNSTPIIMIGPGTGIAPFRAFIQERSLTSGFGKSWLFFGDRNFTTDFLYQAEWLKYIKNKILTRMDVAFSRDQKNKIYVQHKLLENKREIYKWMEEGANIYVCGDKDKMAPDVKLAFRQIVKSEAGFSDEKAEDYIKQLRKQNRYHEDVY